MVAMIRDSVRSQTKHDMTDDATRRYQALLAGHDATAEDWLETQLSRVRDREDDLPEDPDLLSQWAEHHAAEVADDHAHYLRQRREGAPRRYFATRAQALWFLQQVAPTKVCLLYTSPSPRDLSTSRMPSSA